MKTEFDKRIIDIKTQNEDIEKFRVQSFEFAQMKLNPAISKHFSETISIAVAQVNGCKFCSYTHAKSALQAGMSQEDVDMLQSGSFENVPKEQLEALLFAQHYAESKGNPDPVVKQTIIDTYGDEKTKDIMASILMMMLTNLHGNTFEALTLRLKGKGVEGSSLLQEIAVSINFFKVMPIIVFAILKYKLFNKEDDRRVGVRR